MRTPLHCSPLPIPLCSALLRWTTGMLYIVMSVFLHRCKKYTLLCTGLRFTGLHVTPPRTPLLSSRTVHSIHSTLQLAQLHSTPVRCARLNDSTPQDSTPLSSAPVHCRTWQPKHASLSSELITSTGNAGNRFHFFPSRHLLCKL